MNSDPISETESLAAGENRPAVSLSMLFYLVTCGAIVSAALANLADSELVTPAALSGAVVIGAVGGALSGSLAAGLLYRIPRAALWGLLIGAILGATAGMLSLVQSQHHGKTLLIAFAGGWLLIVLLMITARQGPARL